MQVTSSSGSVAASMENDIMNNTNDDNQNSLPPGFKFIPDDQELIRYLQIKVAGGYIIPNRFYDVYIYNYTPQQLDDRFRRDGEDATYFFSPRNRKYPKGKRPDRAVRIKPTKNNPNGKVGFWRASSKDRDVPPRGKKIGTKRNLVYHEGKPKVNEKKTNWLMQEFMLGDDQKNNLTTNETMQLDDWVLCKIYRRQSRTLDHRAGSQENTEQQDVQNSNAQPQPPPQHLQWQPQPINQNDQFATYPSPIPVLHNINTVNPAMPSPAATGYLNHIGLLNNQFDAFISLMPDFPNNNASENYLESQLQQNGFMQLASMPSLQQDNFMLPVHNGLMPPPPSLSSIQGVEINDYSMQNSNAQPQPMNQKAQLATDPSPIPVLNNVNTENPTIPLPASVEYNWEAQYQENGFMQATSSSSSSMQGAEINHYSMQNSNVQLQPPSQQPQPQPINQNAQLAAHPMIPVQNGLMLPLSSSSMHGAEINDYSMLPHFMQQQNESDISDFTIDLSALDIQELEKRVQELEKRAKME